MTCWPVQLAHMWAWYTYHCTDSHQEEVSTDAVQVTPCLVLALHYGTAAIFELHNILSLFAYHVLRYAPLEGTAPHQGPSGVAASHALYVGRRVIAA